MIRSVANRYYRMSRTLACRTWKRFRRIPSGRGDNGTLLFTDDQEIGSRDERAGQRALHTRFGHGSTFLFSPVAAAANGTFTASWSSSPRVSRRRMGRAGGRGDEARRGNSRSRFTRSCTFRYGERTKVSDSRIPRRATASFEIEERWRR